MPGLQLTSVEAAAALLGCRAWPSEDVAVLSAFAGGEAVEFAARHVTVTGQPLTLAMLASRLPPAKRDAIRASALALTLVTAMRLGWPVVEEARVTSAFGWRWHPMLGRQQLHTGVDLAVPLGTPVRASAAGVVTRASEDAVNGRLVIIDHGRGVTTAYCHNQKLEARVGQTVEMGQIVAFSGSTGRSSGPHLHYQVELSGTPVDPFRFRRSHLGAASWYGQRDGDHHAPHSPGQRQR